MRPNNRRGQGKDERNSCNDQFLVGTTRQPEGKACPGIAHEVIIPKLVRLASHLHLCLNWECFIWVKQRGNIPRCDRDSIWGCLLPNPFEEHPPEFIEWSGR